jgi:hypothetical protein
VVTSVKNKQEEVKGEDSIHERAKSYKIVA